MPLFRSHSHQEIQIGIAWPGKRYQLDVNPEILVKELKNKILDLAKIPVEVQHLTYHGKSLKDHQKLRHYKVKHDTTILLTRLGVDITSGRVTKRFQPVSHHDPLLASLSLPAESGRYEPCDNVKLPASTRTPAKPSLDGSAINNVLDNWFAPKPQPKQPQSQDLVMGIDESAKSGISDQNVDPRPNITAGPASSMDSYKPVAPIVVPANPQRMDVMAALLQEAPLIQQEFAPPPEALEKEEDTEVVKFTVKVGKKDIKLKMNCNQDMWAVKLKLEACKVGRAGQMTLLDEDGEELEEEGTLAENNITDGCKMIARVQ